MEKRVARAIGKFDEAETLIGLEPFHHGIDGGTCGRRRHHVASAEAATSARGAAPEGA